MRRARRTSGYVWASLVSIAVIAIAASRSNSGEVPGKTSNAQSKPNPAASPKRKSPISLPSGIRQVSTQEDDLRDARPAANRSADPARLAGLFAQDTNSPALLPPLRSSDQTAPTTSET